MEDVGESEEGGRVRDRFIMAHFLKHLGLVS